MKLILIRGATLRVEMSGHTLLVDPQLDPAGAREPVPDTPNPRANPLVELPEPAQAVVAAVDAVLLTHTHQDHYDETARRLLARDIPIFCQPQDAERLHADGFSDVRPVHAEASLGPLLIHRTDGRHGTGELGDRLGPVSGFVVEGPGEPTLYIAGDTILCDEVREALERHRPDAIVVNAGAARFNTGDPIVMDAEDVVRLARESDVPTIVAVHLDTVSHGTETRADLRARLEAEGLKVRVAVPEDGSEVPV